MASSSTAIPTYSELRSIRRRNASALAQKALDLVTRNGGVMPGPEIMPIFDPSKPLPAPSFMRRFMYRSPSLVLSAASLLQIAALFVFLLPHLSEYCKENQLYEAFALPWVERVLLGSQQVIYFGGVVVVAQIAMLVFMLRSRDDDEKPSALQWFATLLTIVEAGLAFRFSDKPECESVASDVFAAVVPLSVLSLASTSFLVFLFVLCSRRWLRDALCPACSVGRDSPAKALPRC